MCKMNDIRDGIKKEGNWIMVTRFIPVDMPIRPLSIYYGIPTPKKRGTKYDRHIEWMYEITTKYGDVQLRDFEYSVIADDKMQEYISAVDEKDYDLIPYGVGENASFNKKLQDTIFYLRSRGLTYSQALTLSMGIVKQKNIFMLQAKEDYLYHFFDNRECDRLLEKEKAFIYTPPLAFKSTEKTSRYKSPEEKYEEELDEIVSEFYKKEKVA